MGIWVKWMRLEWDIGLFWVRAWQSAQIKWNERPLPVLYGSIIQTCALTNDVLFLKLALCPEPNSLEWKWASELNCQTTKSSDLSGWLNKGSHQSNHPTWILFLHFRGEHIVNTEYSDLVELQGNYYFTWKDCLNSQIVEKEEVKGHGQWLHGKLLQNRSDGEWIRESQREWSLQNT